MAEHDHGGPSSPDSSPHQEAAVPGRRKFLRQVGLTAAATAVVAGTADVLGVTPALASANKAARTKSMLAHNAVPASELSPVAAKRVREIRTKYDAAHPDAICSWYCELAPGSCGAPCHPNGVWCHLCIGSNPNFSIVAVCWGGHYNFCA